MQSIKVPTLIIVGDGEIVTPGHAVEMWRTILGAQLRVVPHAGGTAARLARAAYREVTRWEAI